VVDAARGKTVLRRIVPGDHAILRRWLRDPAVRAGIEDDSIDFTRMQETLALFETSDPYRDGGLGLLVERRGQPIGLIHFIWINWISRNAEAVVFVGPGEMRGSLAAAAVVEKVGYAAFRMLNLHKIYAFIYGHNSTSLSVFKRVMKEEACLRAYIKPESPGRHEDVHFFGMLAEEYHAKMQLMKGRF